VFFGKKKYAAFKWKDAISGFPVSPGCADALARWGGKIKYVLIGYFLGNICAKNCCNRTTNVKIRASQRWDVFWDTVYWQHRGYVIETYKTRMWANVQHDGRPAKYRWRPLFNATKFGWLPLLECRAVSLPRCKTRWNLQGFPKLPNRSQPSVGQSSPYYKDMWRTYCCLTSFFRLSIHALLRRYSLTKNLCDGAEMAIFCIIFASCISSKPRAAHFRPAT